MPDQISVDEVVDLWGRLTGWLASYAPASYDCLRPGASADRLAKAEQQLGFPLHPGLRSLWAMNDGVAEDEGQETGAGLFLGGEALMPVEAALEIRAAQADYYADWGRLWLPFTTNEINEPWTGATVDCGNGLLGAWYMEEEDPETPSGMTLPELLSQVVDAVESARALNGTVPGLADGALVWADPADRPAERFRGWTPLHSSSA
ncbi:hypothetical protein ABTZ59_34980 [Streptomyces sp. NPDC094034]|uniref:hypothetical protein n=1 Tax=Streptomyces sp. NPDC094034 TaxID=3155309 RepID=UPI003329A0AB